MRVEQHDVIGEVLAERERQEELRRSGKFLWTCASRITPDTEKLAVLAEETGEVAREVMEAIIARDKWNATPSAVAVGAPARSADGQGAEGFGREHEAFNAIRERHNASDR